MIKKITNQNQISRHKLAEKINEIIDYINQNNHEYTSIEEVVKARENHIADVSKKVADRMIGCATLKIPESYKTDPHAEEEKWVGKLCKFWDDNGASYYATLAAIDKSSPYPYCSAGDWWWEHCSLVKPGDDIIFKGE